MNGFEDFLNGLIAESEKAIMSLSEIEGSEETINLLTEVQEAIKVNDIDKLNKIVEEHGDIINRK